MCLFNESFAKSGVNFGYFHVLCELGFTFEFSVHFYKWELCIPLLCEFYFLLSNFTNMIYFPYFALILLLYLVNLWLGICEISVSE